jgi:hypothetical protein
MKINWQPNPFNTTIEVDERDKERVVLYLQNEEYTEILCSVHMWLDGKIDKDNIPTLEAVSNKLAKWGPICNMTTESEEVTSFLSYLNAEHMGDCICVPCSCIRCHVEEALGISTLEGLGKHPAYKVRGAFGKDGNLTIDEAIANLEKIPEYKKSDTWPDSVGWDIHIPRWEREREAALKWLKQYKENHNF